MADSDTARAHELWDQYLSAFVGARSKEYFKIAFGEPGEFTDQVWDSVRAVRSRAVITAMSEAEESERLTAVSTVLADFDELLAMRPRKADDETGAGETEPVSVDERTPGSHEQELARQMAAPSPESAAELLARARGTTVQVTGGVVSVAPPQVTAVSMTPEEAVRTAARAGEDIRVFRVDAALLALAQGRAQALLEAAGVTMPPTKGSDMAIPRNVVINAALALVLRAGGVGGIELSDSLELVCSALTSAGDLERNASLDARMALLGASLDRLERKTDLALARSREAAQASAAQQYYTAYQIAERASLVKLPMGAGAYGAIDVAASPVLKVLDLVQGQARREITRRVEAEGRPDKQARLERERGER